MVFDEKSGVAKYAGCRKTVVSGKWYSKQFIPMLFMGTSWPVRGPGVSLWHQGQSDSRKAKRHRSIVVPFSNPQPQTHCVHEEAKKMKMTTAAVSKAATVEVFAETARLSPSLSRRGMPFLVPFLDKVIQVPHRLSAMRLYQSDMINSQSGCIYSKKKLTSFAVLNNCTVR